MNYTKSRLSIKESKSSCNSSSPSSSPPSLPLPFPLVLWDPLFSQQFIMQNATHQIVSPPHFGLEIRSCCTMYRMNLYVNGQRVSYFPLGSETSLQKLRFEMRGSPVHGGINSKNSTRACLLATNLQLLPSLVVTRRDYESIAIHSPTHSPK